MSDAPPRHLGKQFKYYDLIMVAFVVDLLRSNMIGPGKSVAIDLFGFPLVFGAGNLFFPISYILGDILTEVYGYAKARKVIWAGFGALTFSAVMSWVVMVLPPNAAEPFNQKMQPALEIVFGNGFRIVAASMVAFWAGDFMNSFVLAKMKIWTKGRWLWTRTVGSTVVGEGVDSVIFYPIAFAGLWTSNTLVRVILFNWVFKIMVEVVMTPVTYAVVGALKRAENEDYYDIGTNFTPFKLNE